MTPEPRRMAIHQAGHAVVQTIVGRGRFTVATVSIQADPEDTWRGMPSSGAALLDREAFLGLYEYGLVTLAGIAAEDIYLEQGEPAKDPIVALSDLAAWQERAWDLLQDEGKVRLVSLNVRRKLEEWLRVAAVWRVVERLAEALLEQGMIQGEQLRQILQPLAGSPAGEG